MKPRIPELMFPVLFIVFWMSFGLDTTGANELPFNTPTSSDPKTIRVGLRQDAKPFSYPNEDLNSLSILQQHKGFMVAVCRKVLKKMMESPRYAGVEIEPVLVSAKTRFDDLLTGKVDLLCGPDSITSERLEKYNVSHPMFLSGMTYGYVNPTSRKFPYSEYCGNVLGVVNNTTAEATGIRQMSQEGVLLRFDRAVDLNLALDAERYQILLDKADNKRPKWNETFSRASEFFHSNSDKPNLCMTEPECGKIALSIEYLCCTFNPDRREQYIEDKVTGYMNDEGVNTAVQTEISKRIVTSECPNGFTQGMPVRKFKNHNEGIKAFCDGEVLYYLGDYDILRAKVREHANCDAVFNRFTTNKEVYAAFFRPGDVPQPQKICNLPRPDTDDAETSQSDYLSEADSARLYADFNRSLLRLMQSDDDILGEVYKSEFKGESMSADLRAFFSNFRVAADLGQPDE